MTHEAFLAHPWISPAEPSTDRPALHEGDLGADSGAQDLDLPVKVVEPADRRFGDACAEYIRARVGLQLAIDDSGRFLGFATAAGTIGPGEIEDNVAAVIR